MRTLPSLILFLVAVSPVFGQYPADPVARKALFQKEAASAQELVRRHADKFEFDSPGWKSLESGYYTIGGVGGVVAQGTFTSKFTPEEMAALERFRKSSGEDFSKREISENRYLSGVEEVKKGTDMTKNWDRFILEWDYHNQKISQEEYTAKVATMEAEIQSGIRERANILLKYPRLISVLFYEQPYWGLRFICAEAVNAAVNQQNLISANER